MSETLKERYEKWVDDIIFDCWDTGPGFNCSVLEDLCEFVKELVDKVQSLESKANKEES